MREYPGRCHCGGLEFHYGTVRAPASWDIRACDCNFCRTCGVYLAAVIRTPRGRFATLNVNAMADAGVFPAARSVFYGDESTAMRLARREARWTPVRAA